MRISFYEEFPTKENLSKLKLINFPTKIYVSAKSIPEFRKISSKIKKTSKRAKAVCWILLERNEGYWISPWAKSSALKRIFADILKNGRAAEILLDLEMPKNRLKNIIVNTFSFFRNKKLIKEFIKKAHEEKIKIYTAEYSYMPEWLLKMLGLGGYNSIKIKMLYKKPIAKGLFLFWLGNMVRKYARKYRDKVYISPGLIARGVSMFEWIATPEEMNSYLKIIRQEGIKEAVIFRLGGLNKEYVNVIKKFI